LDIWSIGVIILEIICGTDIVLATGCFKHVRLLLDECTEYIDSSTHYLLDQLLNNGNDEVIPNYVNDTLRENPEVIAESIRAIDAAVDEITYFKNMQQGTLKIISDKPENFKTKYNLINDDIVR
jgi:hypothetical protein